MKDKLLSYYNKELSYFREYSEEFAKKHPKVAGHLGIDTNEVDDPHVARLIESVAFMTARVQQNIDAGLPELTQSLFSVLYPDYFAPIPATGIFSFELKEGIEKPYKIEKGTRFRAIQSGMAECRFRTCYETMLYPIQVTDASYSGLPFELPELPQRSHKIQSRLRLAVAATSNNLDEDGFEVERLRFFLKGQQQYIAKLFELIHNDGVVIAISDKARPESRKFVTADCVKQVGFDHEEAVLPYDKKSFSGYRTLSEFYHTPDKFLFFDIEDFNQCYKPGETQKEITFYCNAHYPELEQMVSAQNFVLGATAAINLFEHTPELVDVEDEINDYRVNPSANQPENFEVHHIKEVCSIDAAGNKKTLSPIYKPNLKSGSAWVWNYKREFKDMAGGAVSAGLDTVINMIPQGEDARPKFLQLTTECSNRNLSTKLRLSDGGCQLLFAKPTPSIQRIRCESNLSKPKRPMVNDQSRWQLARHLNLSYLSENGVEGLREVLSLYNFFGLPEVDNMIDGIQDMVIKSDVSRAVIGGHSGVIHGNQMTLMCDEDYYTGTSIYLFGCVLNNFLSQLCQVNSYVKLCIKLQGHKEKSYQWPVLAGKIKLL
ncbi:type VI secretion system baseplate subunit TssF [Kangiella marina]|uniref:Type VI secretion system baseplate subunit TssF n=1 Tax=Kangiella marina TaxID=1079178 RepID=A0ABP8IK51_9GAMM